MTRLIVTAFNDKKDYILRGLTMIHYLQSNSYNSFDKLIVFNLGFSDNFKNYLNSYNKLEVIEFDKNLTKYYPEFLSPSIYAWKCYILHYIASLADSILWIDSGVAVLNDLEQIFEIIEKEDIFLVSNSVDLINKNWTDPQCLELMKANESEKNDIQISANIIGYKTGGKYQFFFDEVFKCACNKDIIAHKSKNHRFDQSIMSILRSRYNIKTYPIEKYAEWRGVFHPEQIFWAYRNQIYKIKRINLNTKKIPLSIILIIKLNIQLFLKLLYYRLKNMAKKIQKFYR